MKTVLTRNILLLMSVIVRLSFDFSDACCDVDSCVFERCKFEIQEELGKDQTLRGRITYILLHITKDVLLTEHGKLYFEEILKYISSNSEMNSDIFCATKYPKTGIRSTQNSNATNCVSKLKEFYIHYNPNDPIQGLLRAYNSTTIHMDGITSDVIEYLKFIGEKVTIMNNLQSEDRFCKIKHCEGYIYKDFGDIFIPVGWNDLFRLFSRINKTKSKAGIMYENHITANVHPGQKMKSPTEFCGFKYLGEDSADAWKWDTSDFAKRPKIEANLTTQEINACLDECQRKFQFAGLKDSYLKLVLLKILTTKKIYQSDDQDMKDYIVHVSENFDCTIRHPEIICFNMLDV